MWSLNVIQIQIQIHQRFDSIVQDLMLGSKSRANFVATLLLKECLYFWKIKRKSLRKWNTNWFRMISFLSILLYEWILIDDFEPKQFWRKIKFANLAQSYRSALTNSSKSNKIMKLNQRIYGLFVFEYNPRKVTFFKGRIC